MKKIVLLLLLVSAYARAQEEAWVYFTDKPDSAYYLANPLEMLSQKALDRRTAQGIALDGKDTPIHPDYIAAVTAANGITVKAKSKWLNALHIRGTQNAINALVTFAFVDHVDFANNALDPIGRRAPAKKRHASAQKTQQTQQNFSYGTSGSQVQMLNGHLLHQQGYTGTGMTIAVLDAGFPGADTIPQLQHLFDNSLVLGGHNLVAQSDELYTGGTHGTLVLSTIAGHAEGELVGTAPDAFYYLFVTEDPTGENPVEESYWVEAAEMADSLGVDVINTSLGYFNYDNADYSYTYDDMDGETAFISRGAKVAFSRGLFLVTAAGNSGATDHPHIGVPADAINTFTVGAVDNAEQYANFSSIGPSADGRIKPDVMAMGQGATYATASGTIATGNGTSFSSPITAGLVACLWQALPGKTNAQLLQLIKQSADRYNTPTSQYGYGIPDFSIALQNGLDTANVVKQGMYLYPNPAKSVVNVAFLNGNTTAFVILYNNLGQVVGQQNVTADKSVFSIENLPTGIYSYKLSAGTESRTGKLVKQ